MTIIYTIVLILFGGFLLAWYAGEFCSNYGETKREKLQRVFQLILLILGTLMFIIGLFLFVTII